MEKHVIRHRIEALQCGDFGVATEIAPGKWVPQEIHFQSFNDAEMWLKLATSRRGPVYVQGELVAEEELTAWVTPAEAEVIAADNAYAESVPPTGDAKLDEAIASLLGLTIDPKKAN